MRVRVRRVRVELGPAPPLGGRDRELAAVEGVAPHVELEDALAHGRAWSRLRFGFGFGLRVRGVRGSGSGC